MFLIIMYEYYFCKMRCKIKQCFLNRQRKHVFSMTQTLKKVHIPSRYAPSKPYWHQPITDSD
ncbi:hypothetical protein HMPREF9441_03901 [Paraprevotella clara YIT 11840]|uniref:Uncharacterized protein n=1 Tax=Paraprevotella clara YIT 11840 TaxID=762968 RepID=G5SWX3_9BACT|nr:hypothetical protein HMPREF9441_03901 [Paraprevotella clara YIT 11840]RGU63191.1 hypothetical protein DWW55_08030 [Paraprevotella clara]